MGEREAGFKEGEKKLLENKLKKISISLVFVSPLLPLFSATCQTWSSSSTSSERIFKNVDVLCIFQTSFLSFHSPFDLSFQVTVFFFRCHHFYISFFLYYLNILNFSLYTCIYYLYFLYSFCTASNYYYNYFVFSIYSLTLLIFSITNLWLITFSSYRVHKLLSVSSYAFCNSPFSSFSTLLLCQRSFPQDFPHLKISTKFVFLSTHFLISYFLFLSISTPLLSLHSSLFSCSFSEIYLFLFFFFT